MSLFRRPFVCIHTMLALFVAASPLRAEDTSSQWNQWRGPNRTGVIESDPWPNSLDEDTLKQLWKVDLGPSYSGPIVADGRVFTTETRDRKFEVVRAFEVDSGKELWKTEWEGAMRVPFFAKANGDWIRSTPAWDDGRLYVAGMRDVLVCLSAKDGEIIWKVDFVKDFETPLPAFGFVCSPLVDGDHVYVQAAGSLVKLDKVTGEVVWRSLKDGGGMYGSAFSSPVMATVGDKRQLIVQTRKALTGVDPESGDVLWSQEIQAFRGMNILTPTVFEGGIFTSSYGGRSALYELNPGDEGFEIEEAWQNKTQGYMSSPVVIDGFAYLHLRNQRFTCVNLETGEIKWTTKPYGKYWSMVANGESILALDERGELLLIKANPDEFELLDSRKIGENTWAHLAVSGDHVYVRALDALIAYRWTDDR